MHNFWFGKAMDNDDDKDWALQPSMAATKRIKRKIDATSTSGIARLLYSIVIAASFHLGAAQSADRPNVLFILTEDQGAHLSYLGTAGLKTPNMDALAKSGVYFKNGFVAYPVCSASKAACYTGLYCHASGILNNTYNFHKPAGQVTPEEKNRQLSRTNRIGDSILTLPEILAANGYFQGVTHKLHVLPNEKFPYDRFMKGSKVEIDAFLTAAKRKQKPWFLLVNIPNSHRPYPNSDKESIRVNPDEVEIPQYLPDTPVVRKDWSEYLAGVEEADALTGQAIEAVKQSGQYENTLVVFMGDHGPTFQHGKMTLYDLGLRVPFAISGPGIPQGVMTNSLASGVDVTPTILDYIHSASDQPVRIPSKTATSPEAFLANLHGVSLMGSLGQESSSTRRDYVFAEISNRGPLPNNGIQERCVFDGHFKLIFRQNVDKAWRQVNADSRQFKVWGNRTYDETIRLKGRYPDQFRILAEMDPQKLGGTVPSLELYDLQTDPDEMNNLVDRPEHQARVKQLKRVLCQWVDETDDVSVSTDAIINASFP